MPRTRLITAGAIIHKEIIQETSQDDKLKMHLVETGLSLRTINTLETNGIHTVGDLLNTTKQNLLSIANFGEKTLVEVLHALDNMGFSCESNQAADEL
jgi:DNA-directed RNA polymerase alpha subunit